MANKDNPIGGRPIRHRSGAPYNGAGNVYHVSSSVTDIIAPGDPVRSSGSATTGGVPGVLLATAGATNYIRGFVIGRTNGPDGTLLQDDSLVIPASTGGYILVEDNPDVVFEMQMSGAFVAGDTGANTNLVSGTASSLGVSGWEAQTSSIGTGNTLQLRILRMVNRVNNDFGDNANVEIMINLHEMRNLTGI